MPSTFVIWRDKFEAILGYGVKYIVPLLSVAAVILGVPAPVAAIMNAIPALMSKLEAVIPAKGSGPVRSEVVLSVMQIAMDTLETNVTGGAATSFEKLKPLIQASMTSSVTALKDLLPGLMADSSEPPPLVSAQATSGN